jgi:hypothetical protein
MAQAKGLSTTKKKEKKKGNFEEYLYYLKF